MRKTILTILVAGVLALAALATPRHAAADFALHVDQPGFSLYAGPPAVYGPPVAVVPPPVVYAPPVYYGRPHKHYWKHWKKHHGRHHGRWGHDWDDDD
jgi:hypothetical protein